MHLGRHEKLFFFFFELIGKRFMIDYVPKSCQSPHKMLEMSQLQVIASVNSGISQSCVRTISTSNFQ